ncbi:glycosyltransferase family 2 protein [Algoriphagus mannitolivorans]|uniref:glycosyltransferase family 2 protein n=1 Tax=Algoriphagus mannitolivorans TaxID=226504 RepID=UPI00040095D3|nr:glycosyltransferase [Algoriphagus mannitolivorans]
MSHPPKVIGFVPAYNAENFILNTLEHLAAQTYSNFEIIIADDASTDRTSELCEAFCEKDSRFTLIKNPQNLGWHTNTESLWLESAKRGKYCFVNPHDDIPYPNFISDLVALMEANPNLSLAIPGMENEYWNSTINSFYTDASDIEDPVERCFRVAKKDAEFWWAAYHALHRSDLIPKVFPLPKLAFGEREFSMDLILLLKMGFYGPFATSDKILFKKIYSKNSVSIQWKHNSKNKAALWIRILKEIESSPLSPSERKELRKRLWTLLGSRAKKRVIELFK